jgi:phage-related minor tail protein
MDERDRRGVDRLTIQEAARRLGVSEGAVRKRVTRDTLEHEKEDDGRVYVYLDTGGRRGVDDGQDEGVDPNSSALISRLEGEVEFLRDQVRRQQEIIAQQAVTMRQLTAAAPQGDTEASETVEEASEDAEPHSATGGAQEGVHRPRSWWLTRTGSIIGVCLVFGFIALVAFVVTTWIL